MSPVAEVYFPKNEQTHQFPKIDNVYGFYKKMWQKTMAELGSDCELQDDFCRFDMISSLHVDGKPAAFLGHTFFNLELECHREHSYFRKPGVPLTDKLQEQGMVTCGTMEYLTVGFRNRKYNQMKLSELLISFAAHNIKRETNLDCLLGMTRTDRRIDQTSHNLGAVTVFENVSMHGVDVSIVCFQLEHLKKYPDIQVHRYTEQLLSEQRSEQEIKIAS